MRSKKGFLKNADLRAGRIPGWPSKENAPESDPFDPNNMERTDASVVVSDGLVMKNAASLNAARHVAIRRIVMCAVIVPLWLVILSPFLANSSFWNGFVVEEMGLFRPKVTDNTSTADSDEAKSGQKAHDLLEKYYEPTATGVAKDYGLEFLSQKMGWPGKTFQGVSLRSYELRQFDQNRDQLVVSLREPIKKTCEGKEMAECIQGLTSKAQYVALIEAGEDPAKYDSSIPDPSDAREPLESLETILTSFIESFPKQAPSYCDSDNRLYAETWHSSTAQKEINDLKRSWGEDGEIPFGDDVVLVKSVDELINHRVKGDPACKNINVTVLEVGTGALEYLVSVKARTRNMGINSIGSALYLVADLNEGRVMPIVSCSNCENIPALDEREAKGNSANILARLSESATGIVDAFADNNMTIEGAK